MNETAFGVSIVMGQLGAIISAVISVRYLTSMVVGVLVLVVARVSLYLQN